MGDMGEIFREMREATKEKRRKQLAEAEQNASGWTKHTPYHWSCDLNGHRLDYWPSTRRWRWRGRMYYGTHRDVANFITKRTHNGDES